MSEGPAELPRVPTPDVVPAQRLTRQTRSKNGRYQSQTIGFPSLRSTSKRVTFDPPLDAKCMSTDGSWSTTVWL